MATRREDILAAYKTALQGITTGNGYSVTINKVDRGIVHPDKIPGTELPALYISGADEERKNITVTNFKSRMKITLIGYVENNNSSEALQQDLNTLIGAVTKKIYADPKLGGLIAWADVVSVATDDGILTPRAVCEIVVEVEYVRPGNEP